MDNGRKHGERKRNEQKSPNGMETGTVQLVSGALTIRLPGAAWTGSFQRGGQSFVCVLSLMVLLTFQSARRKLLIYSMYVWDKVCLDFTSMFGILLISMQVIKSFEINNFVSNHYSLLC